MFRSCSETEDTIWEEPRRTIRVVLESSDTNSSISNPTNIMMQTFLVTFRRNRVISQEPVDLPIQTEKP